MAGRLPKMAKCLPKPHNICNVMAKAAPLGSKPGPESCAGFGRKAPVAMRGNLQSLFEPSNAPVQWTQASFAKGTKRKSTLEP